MDYVAISTLLVGALLVNFGVMMMLEVWTVRRFGGLIVAIGGGLLVISTVTLQQQTDAEPGPTAETTENVEFRTPVVEGLTVRVGPGADYEHATSIWQVHPGDRLRVVDDTLGWIRFHVKYFDPEWSGWVPREYTTAWETYREIERIQRITKPSPSDRSR